MTAAFTESVVEEAALEWLGDLGYTVLHGPDVAPGEPGAERDDYREVVLARRARDTVARLNPHIPPAARDEALRRLSRRESPSLVEENRAFHRMLVDGVPVQYRGGDGRIVSDLVRLVDFEHIAANDWLAINQFTVVEGQHNRWLDVVVFVNGLPLAVLELKNAADEQATIWTAFNQLQTYKLQKPGLFVFNEALVISDGMEARVGSITSGKERFAPWRTIEGEVDAPLTMSELEVLLRGLFDRQRFLQYVRHFVVFEQDGATVDKKIAAYHQFHAVRRAVQATLEAAGPDGDRRAGVVWHTQGSGKSLTMVFYAGQIILERAMENPTLVVLTDRNDLDDQLFRTFSRCAALLRQTPVQAESREDLRRGEELGLTDDEVAFYDALETNDSAVQVLGDETLKGIARELAEAIRRNADIDWTLKESVRARMRAMVRRILRKHGYPPDKQEQAVVTVLRQAEMFAEVWAA